MMMRYQPYRNLVDFPRGFGKLFGGNFWNDDEQEMSVPTWRPATDILETKDEYVFKMELPGISREEVNIEIEDGTLTVKGEKKEEQEVEKDNFHRYERCYGSFSRSFSLPKNINDTKIVANMKNGILELRIPKAEEAKPKAIPIKVN